MENNDQIFDNYKTARTSNSKNRCVICCIAKNENKYIQEWVEYNIKIGFEHIYIYDHNDKNDDSLSHLLKSYKKVTIFDVRGKIEKDLQKKVYTKFYNDYKKLFDWCLFIDIDEFIVLKKWNNINEMVDDYHFKSVDAITFGWRLYGADGKCRRKTNLVFGQFHNEIFNKLNQKKVMVKGSIDNVMFNSVHYASTDKKEVLNQLTPDFKKNIDKIRYAHRDKNAYINHYITKSLNEYINQKLNLVDANLYRTADLNHFFYFNEKTIKFKFYLLYLKIIKKLSY